MSLIIFEDEHLLVVNKPAGVNTHAPTSYAGEGIYDWLKHREPRWARLAIIHRLDKETSGVLVFSKTALANRSLTEQFTKRLVRKKYVLLTDKKPPLQELLIRNALIRAGERYAGSSVKGEPAETWFRPVAQGVARNLFLQPGPAISTAAFKFLCSCTVLEAEPLTGRTHQIRVHASENGFPILGDTLYGGSAAPRVYLHAAEIAFRHPFTGQEVRFEAPADFAADPSLALRHAFIDAAETNCWRLAHGDRDGRPGWYMDKLGDYLLAQSALPLEQVPLPALAESSKTISVRGAYYKRLNRQVRQTSPSGSSPQLVLGEPAPDRFTVRENGILFELSFNEGYSVGLFLDQRDNRRRFLRGHIARDFAVFTQTSQASDLEVLNTFAYTGGFSVCAAKAGARITSLDLSKKYLEWGKRNFALNNIDAARHDFIYGDVFDWLRRLGRKNRHFDMIILDPPTFSASKAHGVFRAEQDYGKLVTGALHLLNCGGILFASSNATDWAAADFLNSIRDSIAREKRSIAQEHYFPQPPDFPISRAEPAYLKTVWMRIA